MEGPSIDELEYQFKVEQEWEFAAPQYYDFLNPEDDDEVADQWFDEKLHDDVSPEIDWDEYEVEHDFGAPTSPAAPQPIYSEVSTPATPHWRTRVEERSPVREDDLMNRIAGEIQVPSETIPALSAKSPSPLNSPYRVSVTEHVRLELEECTIETQSELETPQKKLPSEHRNISISASIPGQTAFSISISTPIHAAPLKPMVATAVVMHPTAPLTIQSKKVVISKPSPKRLTTASAKVRPTTAQYAHKLSQQNQHRQNQVANTKATLQMPKAPPSKLGQPALSRPAPLQPTSQNRLNQSTAASHTSVAKKQGAAPATTTRRVQPNLAPLAKTQAPIQRQPFASQRSVVPPIRTNPAHVTHVPHGEAVRTARVPLAERTTVAASMRAKATTAAIPLRTKQSAASAPAQAKQVTIARRPLTVAVTPEFMKRRTARLKQEPRLTTEQLRTMEADRQRRAFFQELAKKNQGRGLAPRVTFHSQNNGTQAKPSSSVSLWRS